MAKLQEKHIYTYLLTYYRVKAESRCIMFQVLYKVNWEKKRPVYIYFFCLMFTKTNTL